VVTTESGEAGRCAHGMIAAAIGWCVSTVG
jgi:hypothetical protein